MLKVLFSILLLVNVLATQQSIIKALISKGVNGINSSDDDVQTFDAPLVRVVEVDTKFICSLLLAVPPLSVFQSVCEEFEVETFANELRIGFEDLLEKLKEHGQPFIDLLNYLIPLGFHISRIEQDTLKSLGYPIRPALIRTPTLDEFYHVLMIWNNERVPATPEYITAVLKNLLFYTMLSVGNGNFRDALIVNYARLISRVDDQDGSWSNAINDIVMYQL